MGKLKKSPFCRRRGDDADAEADGAHETTRVAVNAVLFTRGINEQQTKARQEAKLRKEIRRDLATQDEINADSLKQLRSFILAHAGDDESPAQRQIEQLFRQVEGVESDSKGAELLQRVAALTRALGGARVTHCKSGKDRTSMSCTLVRNETKRNAQPTFD